MKKVFNVFMMVSLCLLVGSMAIMAAEPTTGNKITNPDFSSDMALWGYHMDNTAMAYRYVNNGEFVLEIQDAGSYVYSLQVIKPDLTIVNGKEYAVYFDARSIGGARTMISNVAKDGQPYDNYSGDQVINLTTTMQRYSYTFYMSNPTDFKARLLFQLGTDATDVVIDNVALYDLSGGVDPTPVAMPTPTKSYDTLVWSDEFNGTAIDTSVWSYDLGYGTNGWGNGELQWYTDKPENARLENGYLVIEARNERVRGQNYTSARLKTEGTKEFQYGKLEMRAKLPYGQGMWPAFWLLGSDISTTGWPACGEIDIMEIVGGGELRDDTTHGTLHWQDAYGGHFSAGGHKTLDTGIFADTFHTFSIVWDENYIYWFLDGVQYNAVSISDADRTEFHQPFFILLNLAVGGNWPGNPDQYTNFPQKYVIDYVRVYQ